jgi:rhodanese-related sulfurtransferase
MKNLQPKEAYAWLQAHPDALFVDVRMEIESLYVGRPPGVVNVPWYEYPDLQPDADKFAQTVAREATGKDQPLLLLCRSGQRTLAAGKALEVQALPTCSMLCMVLKVSWTSISSDRGCRDGGLRGFHGSKCRLVDGFTCQVCLQANDCLRYELRF